MLETNLDWLMEGDPAIRWQTMRDLLDAPEAQWQAERQRTQHEGWGARLLALQEPGGGWGGGIYSPKWVSTTYTMLTLISIGIPGECAPARRGARLVLDTLLGPLPDEHFRRSLANMDRCIVGMILQIAVYFGIHDERVDAIQQNLLDEHMPDGGWNCRRGRQRIPPRHSSFHTTFNVLDGLRVTLERGGSPHHAALLAAERDALEFMLRHRLYKSDRTGEVIHPILTRLSFPYRWYYDVLRGLEYFARAGAPRDSRLQDALELLDQRRRKDGRWPVQEKHAGRVFFDMEKTGSPSRWNTLRALRVLRWWQNAAL